MLYKMQPDGAGQLISRERIAQARAKGGGGAEGPLLFSPWAEWEVRVRVRLGLGSGLGSGSPPNPTPTPNLPLTCP